MLFRSIAASGWDGRIASLDEGHERATLAVGGLRVEVELKELTFAGRGGSETNAVGGSRARGAAPQSGRRGDFGQGSAALPTAPPRRPD